MPAKSTPESHSDRHAVRNRSSPFVKVVGLMVLLAWVAGAFLSVAPALLTNTLPCATITVGPVACASQKLQHPAPARDLYVSQLFRKASAYAEATCYRW